MPRRPGRTGRIRLKEYSAAVPGQNLTRDEARTRARLISVDAYDVDLDLTGGDAGPAGSETFVSTTTVRFRSAQPGASTFVDLIAPSVREIVLNGRALDPAEVFDDSRIALADVADSNELRIVADGAYMRTGEGL